MNALNAEDFQAKMLLADEYVVLDTRPQQTFTQGYIPGSIFVGISSPRFSEWVSLLIPADRAILMVTTPGEESKVVDALSSAGLKAPQGFLEGGFEAWTKAGFEKDMIIDVEADELAMDIPFDENLLVLDVRNETEYADGHVKDAMHIPLEDFTDAANIALIDEHQTVYVHCKSGYRSVIAASILKREGLHNLRNVLGGWDAISQEEKIDKEKDTKALN
jgi:rhodanese-related sulfurtransferase